MVRVLADAGHDVTGLDTELYEACALPEGHASPVRSIRKDVRQVTTDDLAGFDAVAHLAALSNDPLGCLNEDCTYDINYRGSVALAAAAKRAGVRRFIFASSCSLYGAAGDQLLDETAAFSPVTAYGRTKVMVEQEIAPLADETFSPTCMRNATAYGYSPSMRADIVVNNLVGTAFTTGEIAMQSDGTPWRPLVHIEDISRAFLAVLEAPREAIHNQAFNVGSSDENYQMRDIAEIVRAVVPGSRITYLPGGGPDPRCYRVDCGKLTRHLPQFKTKWTVRAGAEELYEQFRRHDLTPDMFAACVRLTRIRRLLAEGRLDSALYWHSADLVTVQS
jgi:nucleoside-diphosphate-sugar epimerase